MASNDFTTKLGKFTGKLVVVLVTICAIALACGLAACVVTAIAKATASVIHWLMV